MAVRGVVAVLLGLLVPASAAVAHGPLGERLERLDRELAAEPADARLHLERGELHRLAGHREAAARDFDAALELDPGLFAAHLYRGRLALDGGRPADAWRALSEYLAHAADAPAAEAAYAFTLRAQAALDLDRLDDAIADYRRAIERHPGAGPELYLSCARLILDAHGDAGRADALAALERGIERLGPVVSLARLARELGGAKIPADSQISAPISHPSSSPWPPSPCMERGEAGIRTPPSPGMEKGVGGMRTQQEEMAAIDPKASSLTRGPYLQLGTSTSAVVRWRTSGISTSRVEIGPAPDDLSTVIDDPTPALDHVVQINGLTAATRWYYAVGSPSGRLAGGDAEHYFETAPLPDHGAAARIWVLGDSGTANANAAAVRDAYLGWAGGPPDLWLMLGDNAYGSGTDLEYQAAVFDMYPSVLESSWLWPAVGNHDAMSADSPTQSGPYFDVFTLPAAGQAGGLLSGTEAYYAFEWGDVHFVVLDSADSDLSPGGAQMQWLAADVAGRDREWLVAFWHHPPYSKGSHDSDNPADSGGRLKAMRENALPILEAAGVDLVLTGHSHAYERSYLLAGHYGTSDTLAPAMVLDPGDGDPAGDGAYASPGTVYAVAGSSGQVGGGSLDHPAMVVSLASLGSLVLDVRGGRLDGVFLDDAGVVQDRFEIVHPAVFADGFEAGTAAAWTATIP